MDVVTILVFLVAVLVVLLLLVIFAPGRQEVRKEYIIEAPYPNYYAFWPSPYYYGWTSGGSSWRPRPFHGRRAAYGYGSGYSTGGGHTGGGHGGGHGGGAGGGAGGGGH
jgi:hypothetical protein